MIEKLKDLNNKLIKYYQNNEEKLKRQILIQKLLNEKGCFFKMKIETAYSILKDLNIPKDDIEKIYLELIDIKYYEELNN